MIRLFALFFLALALDAQSSVSFSGAGTSSFSGTGRDRTAVDLPLQPSSGPNGSNYSYTMDTFGPYNDSAGGHCVATTIGGQLDQGRNYWIFQPHGVTVAPLVFIWHGYGLRNPLINYAQWIQHVVKKGFIVVFVQYEGGGTGAAQYASEAMLGANDAHGCIFSNTSTYTQPSTASGTACTQATISTCVEGSMAHSYGGWLSAVFASKWPANGGVALLAIVMIEPVIPTGLTCVWTSGGNCDLTGISASAKVLIVTGDQDINTSCPNLTGSGSTVCRFCMAADEFSNIPLTSGSGKFFLMGNTDTHGDYPSLFDHNFSLTTYAQIASGVASWYPLNGTDFYTTFKWSVAAFETLTGNTADVNSVFCAGCAAQIGLGNWTDGTAISPLSYFSTPANGTTFTSGACN